MKKSRFSESQIVAILKDGRTGRQGRRDVQEARRERADLLQMEKPVLGHDGAAPGAAARTARRERPAQAHVRGPGPDA